MVLCDGHEAYKQWCLKKCVTERHTKLAYSDKVGVEMIAALKEPTSAAVESAIERTITEALMANPATEYVKDFGFTISGDHLYVVFTVKGREWDEDRVSVGY
jgi:hypothetical protein